MVTTSSSSSPQRRVQLHIWPNTCILPMQLWDSPLLARSPLRQKQIRLCGVRSQLARSYIGRAGCADGCLSFQPVRGSSFPRSRPPPSRVPHLLTWPISLRRLYPLLSPLSAPPPLSSSSLSYHCDFCPINFPPLPICPSSPLHQPALSLQVHVEAYTHTHTEIHKHQGK